jgi:sugar phosphate permease
VSVAVFSDEGCGETSSQRWRLIASVAPPAVPGSRFLHFADKTIAFSLLVYVMSYLDRANIGNAKTGGMEKDLQLTSTQYSVILLIFFVGYVLGEGEFVQIRGRWNKP